MRDDHAGARQAVYQPPKRRTVGVCDMQRVLLNHTANAPTVAIRQLTRCLNCLPPRKTETLTEIETLPQPCRQPPRSLTTHRNPGPPRVGYLEAALLCRLREGPTYSERRVEPR
jgi:hypothetical protein